MELPWPDLAGGQFRLRDRFSDARYDRAGDELLEYGLYLDMPAWQYHVFEMSTHGG